MGWMDRWEAAKSGDSLGARAQPAATGAASHRRRGRRGHRLGVAVAPGSPVAPAPATPAVASAPAALRAAAVLRLEQLTAVVLSLHLVDGANAGDAATNTREIDG